MNNRQRAKNDSYERIVDFNVRNAAKVATIVEYAAEQTALADAMLKIRGAGQVQQGISTSSTGPAATSKETMCITVYKIILRAKVKAKQLGSIELANQFDVPLGYFMNATKAEAVLRCGNMRTLLFDNLATLTNVQQADIDAIDGVISDYNTIKNHPVENRQHIKASGTDAMPPAFDDADEAAGNMYSLLQSYLDGGDLKLVDEFSLCMEVIDTGLRHTVVDITVLANGTEAPIANADVLDTSNDKLYRTNNDGIAHIDKHMSGQCSFTISAAGYQPLPLSIVIKKGVHNVFVARLIGG